MPKGWTETGQPFWVVIWEETVYAEPEPEEGETEEETEEIEEENEEETEEDIEEEYEETEVNLDVSLFRSQDEAAWWVAEEIWERVNLNIDELPPDFVSEIQRALQEGRILPSDLYEESAVDLWMDATDTYFDLPDVITIRSEPLSVRA